MNLHKIFKSLTINSHNNRNSLLIPEPYHPPPPSQNVAPIMQNQPPPDMDDLVAHHLAQRAARMFAAEEAESRRILDTHARQSEITPAPPNMDPPTLTNQTHARRHNRRSRHRNGEPRRSRGHRRHAVEQDPLERLYRTDRAVRASALSAIAATMLDTSIDGHAAAVTLRNMITECQLAGVSFGELLEVEMEGFGMVPLVFQIIRCNWNNDSGGRDLLLFLLEHSMTRKLMWHIRRGCMLRGDDTLFQALRQLAVTDTINPWDTPYFEYSVSVDDQAQLSQSRAMLLPPTNEQRAEFRALISIPQFPATLGLNAQSLQRRRRLPAEKGGAGEDLLDAEPSLSVEWIACERAWSLDIGANHLTLRLQDGEPAVVDAGLTIIKDNSTAHSRLNSNLDLWTFERPKEARPCADDVSNSALDIGIGVPGPSNHRASIGRPEIKPIPISDQYAPPPPRPPRSPRPPKILTFAPDSQLFPVSASGSHHVTLSPCFPPPSHSSFISHVSEGQELLVELSVRLADLKPNSSRLSSYSEIIRRPSEDDFLLRAHSSGSEGELETRSLEDQELDSYPGSPKSKRRLQDPKRTTTYAL